MKEGSPELERAKSAARSLIADQIGLVPPGVSIKILDAVGKAATVRDVYLAFIEWCDAAISKAIDGQTITEVGHGGSLGDGGGAKVGETVSQRLKEMRARRLDEYLSRTLLKQWTTYHHGPDASAPRLRHDVGAPVDKKSEADTELTRAKTLVTLVSAGAKIKQQQVGKEFRLDEAAEGDDLLVAPRGGGVGGGAGLADGTGVCPSCGSHFQLSDAQKKKRSLAWGT